MKKGCFALILGLLTLSCAATKDIQILDNELGRQDSQLTITRTEIESLKKEMHILQQKLDSIPVLLTPERFSAAVMQHSLEIDRIHTEINTMREELSSRLKRIEEAFLQSTSRSSSQSPPQAPVKSSTPQLPATPTFKPSTGPLAKSSPPKSGSSAVAQVEFIGTKEAYKYVGQKKTVCGEVASATYAARSNRQPTFLNLDQPYPNHIFTIVIWGSDRYKFTNPPEIFYKGKRVCVTGVIDTFRGKPQIIARDPSQITTKSDSSSSNIPSNSTVPSVKQNHTVPAYSGGGYYSQKRHIQIGDEVEYYDGESGEYRYGEVQSISGDEIEVYDSEDSEYHYVDRDDIE